jgi:hypothetical protein
MQRIIFSFFIGFLFFESCSNTETIKRDDPLEAGREFISASLKGDYDHAKKYLLPDSLNFEYFNVQESFNKRLGQPEKEGYKDADIIIDSIQNISDSVTIINYSNTFKRKPDKIKLVRVNKEWFVDFKYTFTGNM